MIWIIINQSSFSFIHSNACTPHLTRRRRTTLECDEEGFVYVVVGVGVVGNEYDDECDDEYDDECDGVERRGAV